MFKRLAYIFACFLLCSTMLVAKADNEMPSGSFTHIDTAGGQKSVIMRDMFKPVSKITANTLGLKVGFEEITDITCDESGMIYILSGDSRIIAVNKDFTLNREIAVKKNGEQLKFDGAQGIYVNNNIYIADKENARVICCDMSGEVKGEITSPESELIPEDFIFAPTKVLLDNHGYIYVISEGSYYGALLYSPDGEFKCFYGANTVSSSILSSVKYIWNMITQNDIKRSKTLKTLPYQYIDFDIDSNNFVYTCTGKNANENTGQIRKLNPGGTNVLYKQQLNGSRQDSGRVNFGEETAVMRNNKRVIQNFCSVQGDDDGFFYALDQTYGYIYVYDSDCKLLTAFGGGYGKGNTIGQFSRPISIELYESSLFVADAVDNSVTVFQRTDYGELVFKAQKLTISANYTEAEQLWNKISVLDANNRLAVSGLAKSAFSAGEYEKAARLSEKCRDSSTYRQATKMLWNGFVKEHFVLLTFLTAVLIAVIIAAIILIRRNGKKIMLGKQVKIMLLGGFHPFENYRILKEEKLSSWPLIGILLFVYYLSSVIATTLSNFCFTNFDPKYYSSLYQILQTVGLLSLFAISNWGITTLMQGKGRIKEVFAITACATVPLTVSNILVTILSNTLLSSAGFLNGLSTVFLIFAGIIIVIGLMVIHDYSFPRLIVSLIVTVMFMILAIFVIFMIAMLLSQCWQFIVSVFMEITSR